MTEDKRKYLFEKNTDDELIAEYRKTLRKRDEVGYFSLSGKLAGETKDLIFDEGRRRGIAAELAAVTMVEEAKEADTESVKNLLETLQTATKHGGDLSGFYDEDGDPIEIESSILETFLWVLHEVIEGVER